MNKAAAIRILLEFERRNLNKPNWLAQDFPKQNEFIQSTSPLKAVQCTRRAGKSFGAGLYAMKTAYENPGVNVLIIGLTRDSVKRIFFKDIITEINTKFNIKAKPNASDLTFTLPNGSIIYLLGVDAKPDDMNKLLGQKNKLVIIDESAFFRQDLNKLVYEILKPSVADLEGTIALISTTSNLTNTLYHDITTGKEKGWEVFKWTAYDNPFMAEQWDKEIKFLKKHKPGIEQTPAFRRMYLNEWYVDTDQLIYRFDEAKNTAQELPAGQNWKYVLGIDLGYEDPTALVVCAYNDHDPNLYVVDTFKQAHMIISDVAEKIKEFDDKYNFSTMVIDNASKQSVEELRRRYQLPLVPAEKQGKRDFIEMLNSDLVTSTIKLLPNAAELRTEWGALVWDEREIDKGRYVEHPKCPNHLADAFLYAWRFVYNYTSKPKLPVLAPNSKEKVDEWWEQQAEQVELQSNLPMWERDLI